MKVCTDACFFGAWIDLSGSTRVLDVGAGTGLLSLMIAQRYPELHIDAVEIDQDAAEQAKENVAASPFRERVHVLAADIRGYLPEFRYDALLTNPPFFQNDLQGPDLRSNQAHHAVSMTFADIIDAADQLLNPDGRLHVLLPVDESISLEQMANARDWHVNRQVLLAHDPTKRPFRRLTTFSRKYKPAGQECVFTLDAPSGNYTDSFKTLLKDFYLAF